MDGSLFLAPAKGNARGSGYERNANDWYVEPPWFVEMLLDAELFVGGVWDPCCGLGTIPLVCAARGFDASGSDMVDRGFGVQRDVFRTRRAADNIITNPPFNRSEAIVAQALACGVRKLAIVAEIGFLSGEKRSRLFLGTPLKRIWLSPSRVPMPPGQMVLDRAPQFHQLDAAAKLDALIRVSGMKGIGGTAMNFIWLVWDRSYHGETLIGWLPPRPKSPARMKALL